MKNRKEQIFDTMWLFLEKGHQKANIPVFVEYVEMLITMMKQKTAGQRKNAPKDISFDELDMNKNSICIEARALVRSGELDNLLIKQEMVGEDK